MTRFGLAALSAPLLLAAPAWAADWTLDPAHSRLGFSATQVGSPFSGRFDRFQASITFDPAAPGSAHVVVLVDLASARSGDVQRDTALLQADWFDTQKAAQARFEATGFVPKGGNAFQAPGTLTLRGISRALTLAFTLDVSGSAAHAVGHAEMTRTDWGVGQGQWSSGDMVGLPVTVTFDITATRMP